MKKYIILFGIIFLIITTSIVKSSTRQLEKKIFILTEEVKILEEKYDFFCVNISNFHGLLASVALGACAHPKFFFFKVEMDCILNSIP